MAKSGIASASSPGPPFCGGLPYPRLGSERRLDHLSMGFAAWALSMIEMIEQSSWYSAEQKPTIYRLGFGVA